MDRETFTKGLEITLSKTNMPNGNGIDLENICKDFALLAYDEAINYTLCCTELKDKQVRNIRLKQNYDYEKI